MKKDFCDYVCEVANLRNENEHLRRILSETKLAIEVACENDEKLEKRFLKTLKMLQDNGVKSFYALGFDLKDYENVVYSE